MKTSTREDYEKRIGRVVAAIEADPGAARSLEKLAALANFSPFHFHRIYRAMRGESVFETIRSARMRRAARELASSRRRVIEIGLEIGFESAQSFARAFKAFVSVNPSRFRSAGRTFAEYVSGGGRPPMREGPIHLDIVDQAPLRLHAVGLEGPVTDIGRAWRELWRWAVDRGLPDKIEFAVGVCRDRPDLEGKVIYHAGLVLRGAAPLAEGVEMLTIEGGRYASYRFLGPYDGIAKAFPCLFGEWLPSSDFEADDRPTLEVYRNNPYDTPAHELVTDLMIPVRPRG